MYVNIYNINIYYLIFNFRQDFSQAECKKMAKKRVTSAGRSRGMEKGSSKAEKGSSKAEGMEAKPMKNEALFADYTEPAKKAGKRRTGKEQQTSYPCDECDRFFAKPHLLKAHKKVHDKDVIICELCSKEFGSNDTLKRHMKVHLGIKEF